jgi:hypothetical protein
MSLFPVTSQDTLTLEEQNKNVLFINLKTTLSTISQESGKIPSEKIIVLTIILGDF